MARKKCVPKGKKITLKMAKNALRMTPEGKRRLDLSNMGIDVLPKCILKLKDMEELDLSRNHLKKLPDFIGQLTTVSWIDLHSNKIEQLPKSIGQLEALCHLNLCNNCLDSAGLPPDLGNLRNLQSLNLGMNRFKDLPPSVAALTNLRELGLFDNELTAIPDSILELPNLKKINTKRNPMVHVKNEPKDMQVTEGLYLLREADLCKLCLKKCQEERPKMKTRKTFEQPREKSDFTGLICPNSVAKNNQEMWR